MGIQTALTSWTNLPMILCHITSILHGPPLSPWLDAIGTRGPDLLSPNDILHVQRAAIVHDPFSDGTTTHCGDPTAIRAHLDRAVSRRQYSANAIQLTMSVAFPQQ